MRWLLILLIACGGKKDESKPASGADVAAVVKSTTLLDEAKQILTAKKKRDASAWVALARAQIAANQNAAAVQTLGAAVEAARADAQAGPFALVEAADAYWALKDGRASEVLDEAILSIPKVDHYEERIATLLSPVVHLEYRDAVERLVRLSIDKDKLHGIVLRMSVDEAGPWGSVLSVVGELEPRKRAFANIELSQRARRVGKPARTYIAPNLEALANEPALLHALMELALAGDPGGATLAAKPVEKRAHSEEASERALTLAILAELNAYAGDVAASARLEKQAMLAAEKGHEELDEEDYPGAKVGDAIWVALAVARVKRKNVDGALALAREHLQASGMGELAYALVEQGERDAAQKIIDELKGEQQFTAIADIVESEAGRGELEQAKTRVLAAPQWKGARPGIDHVMRGYALAGDIKAVRELGMQDKGGLKSIQLDAFTDLAARMLARRGKCDEAVAASRDVVVMRGECLAVIARYCPNSKL